MLALDNGIANGNFNAADVFFLVGCILAAIAALAAVPRHVPPDGRYVVGAYAPVIGWLALSCIGLGLFLL